MQIKFEDVSFIYKALDNQQVMALKNINLDLTSKEIIAIVGHTGSGKSTAMQQINGLLQPTSGTVHVNEYSITHKKNKRLMALREHIGYVFQNPTYQLFANSVLEDVMYGPLNFGMDKVAAEAAAVDALKLMGVESNLFERYPFELSGGQMRKVAIAGALAYHPKVLIFDEPTVGLDQLAIVQLQQLFKKLNQELNKQILFITHDMEFVYQVATRIIVFSKGEIQYDGSPQNLFIDTTILENNDLQAPLIYQIANKMKEKNSDFTFDNNQLLTMDNMIKAIKKWKD